MSATEIEECLLHKEPALSVGKEEHKKITLANQNNHDVMTSSIVSVASSSLSSPVDSGVQMLDSESEMTSQMTNSCILSYDNESPDNDCVVKNHFDTDIAEIVMTKSDIANQNVTQQQEQQPSTGNYSMSAPSFDYLKMYQENFDRMTKDEGDSPLKAAKSDETTDLMNVSLTSYELLDYTLQNIQLANNYEADMHVSLSEEVNEGLRVALSNEIDNSGRVNDHDGDDKATKTTANKILSGSKSLDDAQSATNAHVAVRAKSIEAIEEYRGVVVEEEQEQQPSMMKPSTETAATPLIDEQIVFRRQRKKKGKSDTPKKRVSFHEDILNSTRIDDVHIDRGFVTIELEPPDLVTSLSSLSSGFFKRGRKPDIVHGRYSWAAEGDASYNENDNNMTGERQIKSDMFVPHCSSSRFSSTSSSSSASISSSVDEEDGSGTATTTTTTTGSNDETAATVKKEPTFSAPKSSCLKKKPKKKCIKTDIVEEVFPGHNNKRSESTNLLDANHIFGSLKNILNFSTSVPLAERGVPEGQEDFSVYSSSSSHDLTFETSRRSSNPNLRLKAALRVVSSNEPVKIQQQPAEVIAKCLSPMEQAKCNMKLTKSEGFYPNYPPSNAPANILVCDSNVYEHKGISYSYEYDAFQKNFKQHNNHNKPKSSTLYQKILKEFNFFKRKAKQENVTTTTTTTTVNGDEFDGSSVELQTKPQQAKDYYEIVDIDVEKKIENLTGRNNLSAKMDWSDNETVLTISDCAESAGTRHLNSPKRRVSKPNHYSLQSFTQQQRSSIADCASAQNNLRMSSSKNSLINRFLRNVTMKKMLDMRIEKKQKSAGGRYLNLYVKTPFNKRKSNEAIDRALEQEIITGRRRNEDHTSGKLIDRHIVDRFKREVFRRQGEEEEEFLHVFPVNGAYTTSGDSKPLMFIITNACLYVTSCTTSDGDNAFRNHFVLPHADLNTVLIGPDAQVLHFANRANDMQFMLSTGCAQITGELMSKLEMAVRRGRKNGWPRLPAVKQIDMRDMANLRRAISKQTAVEYDEEYYYYSIVTCQEYNCDGPETPLGPNKEGPLMFRVMENESRWETAYFILKAGVLYMLASPTHRVPMRVLPLINGACQVARRVHNCHRPHTFQIAIGSVALHLAAPDEYVASDWLQALVQAASGTFNQTERISAPSCSILMTAEHILTVREAFACAANTIAHPASHNPIKGAQALSCALISDLTAFRLPSAEHSWCVLEFACREVHEVSGDWILYFATNAELERFISTLEMLWEYNNEDGDSFPLSTIPETDSLSKRCSETYRALQQSWPHVTHYY